MDVHFLTSQGGISNFLYYIKLGKAVIMRVDYTTSKKDGIARK